MHFPDPLARLTPAQVQQLRTYAALLQDFNRKINLISREDVDQAWDHHLVHCLALTARDFPAGSTVVDWGTGGGLPAIPLAIAFPHVQVHAVDAVEKKVRAVQAMGRKLGLANLHPWHGRAEAWPGRADYAVSRATAPLADLWSWYAAVRTPGPAGAGSDAGTWPRGLICLKGGDLSEEAAALHRRDAERQVVQEPIEGLQPAAYYAEKYVVVVF